MEFCTLAEQHRLNEFKLQIDAINRGVASVIPIQLLYPNDKKKAPLRANECQH